MDVATVEKGGVVVLQCSGSLDASNVAGFKREVRKMFEGGKTKFVFDASRLSFIDSIGLGAVISLLRNVREKKGDIKMAGLNSDIQEIFDITRLGRLFEVYKNVEEAVAKYV